MHHALCNQIQSIFESGFIYDSYANRIGKGTHRALNRCQYYARKYKFVLQCDIRQFFPSIDHQILTAIIQKKISDQEVLWLINKILDSGKDVLKKEFDMVYFPGDDLFAINRTRGLPIGNLTSQFWANVYLTPFDNFIKRELGCKAYLRYVDDFLLFDDDKIKLHFYKREIIKKLARYRLILHPGTHPYPVSEGIPFLGFIVFPEKRRLKRRKGVFFQRKLKNMLSDYSINKISEKKLNDSIQGWINHIRYGNTTGLMKSILGRNIL